jgi:hypothetical protein
MNMAMTKILPRVHVNAQPANAMQYVIVLQAANAPLILMPANPNRIAFLIANGNSTYPLYFSLGPPFSSAMIPLGAIIAPYVTYDTVGLYVPITDVYVWYGTGPSFTITVSGYEFTAVPPARPS